jgi:uncharacterized OB-fold protein
MTPMQQMTASAARGRLALQRCVTCGTVQYPPRELCSACLADQLEWRTSDTEAGEVLASTVLHHSHETAFDAALPIRVGLVQLDPGPTVVCFLTKGCDAGTRVWITASIDAAGRAVLTAVPVPSPSVGRPERETTPAADPPRAAAATPSR